MEVRHFLMSGRTRIGEDAIAAVGYTLLFGDVADSTDQRRYLLHGRLVREVIERDVFALGNHQNVRRALRADVVESEDMRVLVNPVAGNLPAEDAGEHI